MEKLESLVGTVQRGDETWLYFRMQEPDDTLELASALIRVYCDYLLGDINVGRVDTGTNDLRAKEETMSSTRTKETF